MEDTLQYSRGTDNWPTPHFMQYVAMMVGAWGAWVVLRVIASEREARMRTMQQPMTDRAVTTPIEASR